MEHERGLAFFREAPPADLIFFRGCLYDLAPGQDQDRELALMAREPELLNQREADLALVAYNAGQRSWRLMRDFGPTPLYYAPRPGGFAWSFTYTGLLSLLDEVRPDEATLFDYTATHYRYIFRDPARTFHQGVYQVPAGAYVDIDERGLTSRAWLKLDHDPELCALGPEEASGRLMEILRRGVRLRAKAARRPAFTVSSGLDSSTVASLAAEELGGIDVFSVGYQGAGSEEYDETAGVAELVRDRDWRWTHLMLEKPDLVAETEKYIGLSRSPVVTVTWLAYYLMGRQLSGFSEMFNGLGGDESLAGEFGHFPYFFADLKKAGQRRRLTGEVEAWSRLHDHPIFKKNLEVLKTFWERNIDFQSGEIRVDQALYQANRRFFNPDWFAAHGGKAPPMPRPYPSFLSNRLWQEISHETTPPTLWGLQLANQNLGLRGVSPFLSPRLFKLCLSLPGAVKYDRGLSKSLLRRSLKGVLPESLRLNPKKVGFNAPIHQWFKDPKVSRPTRELLSQGPLVKKGWLKAGAAGEIFREHESGQANHMMLLWALLNASLFLEA